MINIVNTELLKPLCMDKMLDSGSTQSSSLFHCQDHATCFRAFHVVPLLLLQIGCSLKPFAFWTNDVVDELGFPFSLALPRSDISPLSEQELGPDHC